jgi:hypothetical protein
LSLLSIHRLLIGSGIAVCVLYTLRQGFDYVNASDPGALWRALVAILGAVMLFVYLRSLRSR